MLQMAVFTNPDPNAIAIAFNAFSVALRGTIGNYTYTVVPQPTLVVFYMELGAGDGEAGNEKKARTM